MKNINAKENSANDVIPYKMDFKGADKIIVTRTDYTTEGYPVKTKEINDTEIINRIVNLLEEIPKNGDMMKSMVPHTVHEVKAYRKSKPFAMFSFSRSSLRTENTGFNVGDQAVKAKEDEIFNLIEIK